MADAADSWARFTQVVAGRRVPLGFVFGLIVLGLAQPTPQSLVAGGLVACAGEGLRFWAAGHLNKSREVTMSGPYRWLAHPLYVGSSILGIGLALASRSVIASLLIGAYLLLTLTVAARQEEALLQKMFGDRYAGYRRGSSPADVERRFSLAQAIANGEHRTIAGLALVGLLLAGKATYNGSLG